QAEDGIRDDLVTGVQTCALPISLRLDQLEDYGAFLRAPMPGPLYRMHGAVTGAYDIANVEVTNRVVLTNKMPASLVRGFGGPQRSEERRVGKEWSARDAREYGA